MKNSSEFIQFAIECGVLQFGEFKLKSGRLSPYFFNTGLFNDGNALYQLGRFYAQAIVHANLEFDVLFGPAYKGIPLVAAVAMSLFREHDKNYPYAFNRKEAKSHGDGGQVVGAALQGKVLIIDDVITAGTAVREAVQIIAQTPAQPGSVLIAFDRQERGQHQGVSAVQQIEQEFNLDVVSVATVSELVDYAQCKHLYAQHLEKIKQYVLTYRPDPA